MKEHIRLEAVVPSELHGKRADVAAAALWPAYSRGKLQSWIKQGGLQVDGSAVQPKQAVAVGSKLTIDTELEAVVSWQAESMPLNLVYHDDDIIVVNKPVGLVVHPGAGNWEGTLVNALLAFDPKLEQLPRAGIVHRLDKDTSGVMVVARSQLAHHSLVEALQAREVSRHYIAIAHGALTGGGKVDAPIGRHPTARKKMAVVDYGKPAVTHFNLVQRYRHFTQLKLSLETGRTHQIRVHMAHRKNPLVGDSVYGGRSRIPADSDQVLVDAIRYFPRQALHAEQLSFQHPASGDWVSFHAPIPEDLQNLIDVLDRYDRA